LLTVDLDITPNNVLLRLTNIDKWSANDVNRQLGIPITDEVVLLSEDKPSVSAPRYLVPPTSFSSVASKYISEELLLIDLGEAFFQSFSPPKGVGTPVPYCSPELILQGKASASSDIWALCCTMFEMRAGFPLFESFVGSPSEVLQEIVRILGTPPKPLWPSLEQHEIYIGQHESSCEPLLAERVREIGMNDEEPSILDTDTPLFEQPAFDLLMEPSGTKVPENEAESLAGLLQSALNYTPDKRLSAAKIVKHKWFIGGY